MSSSISNNSSSLEQKLTTLKLGRIKVVLDTWLEHAATHQLDYGEFLEQLLTEELLARQENQLRKRMQAACFPYAATLEQFDFSIRPELKRPVMLRYFDSSFVEKTGSLVLVGPSGLGKTHLAIALGTRMVQLGYSVRFVTAQQVANTVLAAQTRVERERVVQPLIKCHVLIVDEFGYLPLEPSIGPVLYEIIAGRYEHGATVVTSNKSLGSWGDLVGGDSALMMALLDRLLHHGEVFYLRGASYRMRGKEGINLGPGSTNGNTNGSREHRADGGTGGGGGGGGAPQVVATAEVAADVSR